MYPLAVACNVLSRLIVSVTHRAAAFVCHSLRRQRVVRNTSGVTKMRLRKSAVRSECLGVVWELLDEVLDGGYATLCSRIILDKPKARWLPDLYHEYLQPDYEAGIWLVPLHK
ncbi:hypothetical protein IW262DRAFT_1478679 [Armillaria fumosa]|nr:hypothetical protein IW262DRAFT_1478679 [Armillaria fumosa]